MSEITAKQLEKLLKNASEEMMDAVRDGLLMGAELAVGALDESTKRNLNKHGKSKKRSRSSVSGSSGLALLSISKVAYAPPNHAEDPVGHEPSHCCWLGH